MPWSNQGGGNWQGGGRGGLQEATPFHPGFVPDDVGAPTTRSASDGQRRPTSTTAGVGGRLASALAPIGAQVGSNGRLTSTAQPRSTGRSRASPP